MLNMVLRGAIAAGGISEAEQPPDLPFFGQYYGCGVCGPWSAANTQIRQSSAQGQSFFFYGERTGVITQIRQHWRTYLTGYAAGDGGTYTIEIKHADPVTKLPITTGSPICSISGISPRSTVENTWKDLTHTFATQGQVIAKEPYCLVYRNTHANPNSNYVSTNISLHTAFDDDDGGDYQEPSGINPASVGGSIVAVSGWSPVVIDGTTRWYPWPAVARDGAFRYRRIGPLYAALKYEDGQWVGWGAAGGGQTYHVNLSTLQLRERFRVTRATRLVSGVFVRVSRKNGSSGNFVVRLESGPASDTSGNGTLIEQVTVPAFSVYDVGSFEWLTGDPGGSLNLDLVPYLWVPFTQNRTLTLGQFYSLRFSSTGNFDMWVGNRSDTGFGPGPDGRSLTQDQWEAQRQIEWTAWEDSRGMMWSSNGGTTWSFGTQRLTPAIFKCVL